MITPLQGFKIDPQNPNQVIRDTNIITSDLLATSNLPNIQTPPQISQPDIKNIPITTPAILPETKPETSPFITEIETLTSKLLGKEVEKEKRITEKTADFSTALNELNTQIKLHQANALARQEEALKSGETLRYSTGQAGQVARTDAIEAMKLSALAQGMQGNILLATKQAESAINAEFSQTERDLETKRQNILNNYVTFTPAEKKRADAALERLDKEDAFVARSKADREQAYKIAVEAAKNGLTDTRLLTKIQNSTPEKALKLSAPYLEEKEKPLIREFEVNGRLVREVLDPMTGEVKSRTDLGAAKTAVETTPEIENILKGEFGDIIKSASNLVGAEKGKTSKVSIVQAIADNDFTSAYAQIANNVEDALTGEVKTKFANSRTDYNVMFGMRNAIQEFADAGGNMGYLKGTADEIARKFGQLSTDPKFAALAVQLQREFQTYRLNMTGAAFSPAESKEYANVNPRTTASLDLNLATIDGALNQLENRITSTVNSRIPNAKKIYQKIGGDGMSDDDAYKEYLKLTGQSSGQR